MDIERYRYLYETHMHTSGGSLCGRSTGREMAESAKAEGYTGIIITEHNWGGNTCVDGALPWEQWVDAFTLGYREAKAYGDENDLDVFWGYEAGFDGTEFLIYGVDPDWLKAHPQLREADMAEHSRLVRAAGGLVVHAHPFREESYIPQVRLVPSLVDAVEAFNGAHLDQTSRRYHPEFNDRALVYARTHGIPLTAGSDAHRSAVRHSGVAFDHRLADLQEYCFMIRKGEGYILSDGVALYDSKGCKLGDYAEAFFAK